MLCGSSFCCSESSDAEDSNEDEGGMTSGIRAEDAEERDELNAEADMDIEELLKKYVYFFPRCIFVTSCACTD